MDISSHRVSSSSRALRNAGPNSFTFETAATTSLVLALLDERLQREGRTDQVLARPAIRAMQDLFCYEGASNMTYLALNASHYVNGVAKRHAEQSRPSTTRRFGTIAATETDSEHRSRGPERASRVSVIGSAISRQLTLFKVAVRRIHRAVVHPLYEMNELDVRLDVSAARHQIVGVECLRREHVGELLAESLLNGRCQ